MNIGYLTYLAERTLSAPEQRATDTQRGELARALSGLLRSRRGIHGSCQAASTAIVVPDYLPADWVTPPR